MKQKLIILRGLPATGKTTYSMRLIASEEGKDFIYIDMDRILYQCHYEDINNTKFNVSDLKLCICEYALSHGKSVIVDGLNLKENEISCYDYLVKKYDCDIEIKDLSVDVEEAVIRDKNRSKSIGEYQIRNIYKQHKIS